MYVCKPASLVLANVLQTLVKLLLMLCLFHSCFCLTLSMAYISNSALKCRYMHVRTYLHLCVRARIHKTSLTHTYTYPLTLTHESQHKTFLHPLPLHFPSVSLSSPRQTPALCSRALSFALSSLSFVSPCSLPPTHPIWLVRSLSLPPSLPPSPSLSLSLPCSLCFSPFRSLLLSYSRSLSLPPSCLRMIYVYMYTYIRPTQSIIYVPLQVNRFQKII